MSIVEFSIPEKQGNVYISKIKAGHPSFHVQNIPTDKISIQNNDIKLTIPFAKSNIDVEKLERFRYECIAYMEKNSQAWFHGRRVSSKILQEITTFTKDDKCKEENIVMNIPLTVYRYVEDGESHEEMITRNEFIQSLNNATVIENVLFTITGIHFYQHTALLLCECTHISFPQTKEIYIADDDEIVPLPQELESVDEQTLREKRKREKEIEHIRFLQSYLAKEFEEKSNQLSEKLNHLTTDLRHLT